MMDYKREIIEMIEKIESTEVLRYIYIIVADIEEDRKGVSE